MSTQTTIAKDKETYDHTVLPDLNVVPYGRCLHDRVRAHMYVVTDLHGIVVEVAAIRLVRWSARRVSTSKNTRSAPFNAPHHASFADQAVPSERYDDSMSRPRSSEVAANDCVAGDDGLPAQDDVLGAGDGRAARDFVACVLLSIHDSCRARRRVR